MISLLAVTAENFIFFLVGANVALLADMPDYRLAGYTALLVLASRAASVFPLAACMAFYHLHRLQTLHPKYLPPAEPSVRGEPSK
ncbi:MAG: hypothetical protein VX152_12050 [Pseudomonadota bacterium]|nr:hypothetical protein [Pseudomonadota bacterium]